jgi:hypothetical protein
MKMKTRSCKTTQYARPNNWLRLPTSLTIGLLQYFERKHDVILFAIDCSQSMLALHEDPNYENTKTSRLLKALDAAVQIQKRKVVVGPYDSVGILLYNTVRVQSRNAALSPVTTWLHRRAGMKLDQAQISRKEHTSTNLCPSLTHPRFLT